MTIQSVFDPSFSKYGQVLTGYDLTGLLDTLEQVTPVPEGTEYVPEQSELMALPVCGSCPTGGCTSPPARPATAGSPATCLRPWACPSVP